MRMHCCVVVAFVGAARSRGFIRGPSGLRARFFHIRAAFVEDLGLISFTSLAASRWVSAMGLGSPRTDSAAGSITRNF